ncbi:DUF2180 family protein [Methanohalobium sp.]|uniref:DUF2180 family protein n=1 Tax=Methanohalobium sp. TaxID=2837493 RepID=UPI0025E789A4|nr:DUF2180 family protein [Methanohalobium sp.]
MMKCYDCMNEGVDKESTGTCTFCGKGICSTHTKKLELPVSVGTYPNFKRLPEPLPIFVCNECADNIITDSFD